MRRTALLVISLLSALPVGCAGRSRGDARAVAVGDDARIYLVGAGEVWILDQVDQHDRVDQHNHVDQYVHGLRPAGTLALPCVEPVDVETHAGALYLLCGDGRVFASEAPGRADAWQLRLPALEEGVPTALQRADQRLTRVSRRDPPRPRDGGIRFDGPGPTHVGDGIADRPGAAVDDGLGDRWHGAGEESPSTSDAEGRAFLFSARLSRRAQLSLSRAGVGNVRCRVRRWHAPIDVAIDPRGRTFASLSWDPGELVVVRLGDRGRVRASAHDPRSGARLRGRVRCVR